MLFVECPGMPGGDLLQADQGWPVLGDLDGDLFRAVFEPGGEVGAVVGRGRFERLRERGVGARERLYVAELGALVEVLGHHRHRALVGSGDPHRHGGQSHGGRRERHEQTHERALPIGPRWPENACRQAHLRAHAMHSPCLPAPLWSLTEPAVRAGGGPGPEARDREGRTVH